MLEINVDDKPITMEVDTGASLSVIGENEYREQFGEVRKPLLSTKAILKTFSGEKIKPLGIASVNVNYNGQSAELPLIVTPGRGPALLGRNWLEKVKLDWNNLFA